jgi:hypothetical protein
MSFDVKSIEDVVNLAQEGDIFSCITLLVAAMTAIGTLFTLVKTGKVTIKTLSKAKNWLVDSIRGDAQSRTMLQVLMAQFDDPDADYSAKDGLLVTGTIDVFVLNKGTEENPSYEITDMMVYGKSIKADLTPYETKKVHARAIAKVNECLRIARASVRAGTINRVCGSDVDAAANGVLSIKREQRKRG